MPEMRGRLKTTTFAYQAHISEGLDAALVLMYSQARLTCQRLLQSEESLKLLKWPNAVLTVVRLQLQGVRQTRRMRITPVCTSDKRPNEPCEVDQIAARSHGGW